jgi:23S rRNA A2030 N6-methylase RlmJ
MKRMTTLSGAVLLTAALAALTGCVETAGTTVTTDHMTGSSLVMEDSTRLRDQIQMLKVNYDEVNGLSASTSHSSPSKHRACGSTTGSHGSMPTAWRSTPRPRRIAT